MRSRQINFFILPEDWKEINDFLKEEDALFIKQPIFDPDNYFSDNIFEKAEKEFDKVCLTKDIFKDNIKIKFIENQTYYLIDDLRSYVIEFSRGGFYPVNPNELHRARLYFVTSYYDENGEILKKDEDFINWAANLMIKFKKKFLIKHQNDTMIYYSKRTIEWMVKNNKKTSVSGSSIQ